MLGMNESELYLIFSYLNDLEKISLFLRLCLVLNWIYFMVNERSDVLCTIPQSLLGRRIGRSECPFLSPLSTKS